MKFHVIIPARYASTRLLGKPLLLIAGKPMLQHVYERACQSGAAQVIIATDDQKVQTAATAFGATVCMTQAHHQSGTERLAEVVDKLALDADEIIVNVQGDEPLIPPAIIGQVATNLAANPQAVMATLAEPIRHREPYFDPNCVKVVLDKQGYALYFSRAPIPWERDALIANPEGHTLQLPACYRHIGIYAYRAQFIKQYMSWPSSPIEQLESLEQLRVLWQGEKIHVDLAHSMPPAGVDTPADLARVRAYLGESLDESIK